MRRALVVMAAVIVLLAFGYLAPVHLPFQLDFQVLWHADEGILQGVALYEQVRPGVLPFPYPPWYAASTLFLARMPIEVAARVWLGLNLFMIFGSIWILTTDWPARRRLLAFILAPIFPPVLGTLLVGQFVLPVLFGATLLVHALKQKSTGLVGAAAALLMFKPHLGALPLIAAIVHLSSRGDRFGRRALMAVAAAAGVLFAAGYAVQPAWPMRYLQSLAAFRQVEGVSSCDLCASLPVWLVRVATGAPALAAAVPIGAVLLAVMLVLWLRWRPAYIRSPERSVATTLLFALLASPYLLNYDFVLLLIPLAALAGRADGKVETAALASAYLLPWLALALLGRAGNVAFSFGALVLLVVTFITSRELEARDGAHHNHSN